MLTKHRSVHADFIQLLHNSDKLSNFLSETFTADHFALKVILLTLNGKYASFTVVKLKLLRAACVIIYELFK